MSKVALLIGINYTGTNAELNGCINDVHNIKSQLVNHFGYKEENITVLSDEENNKPTAVNIMHHLAKVIIAAYRQQVSEIWVHYSGHGASIVDSGVQDEKDGRDEAIVPLDYQTAGVINDDFLHYYLQHLPDNCKCVCFFDCCHSGTILDLKYNHFPRQLNHVDNENSTIESNIIMFSGCLDDQTSADYYNQNVSSWRGAMTDSLIHCLREANYNITCKDLLENMQLYLSENNFTQIPKLSTSRPVSSVSVFCAKDNNEPFVYSL